MGVRAHLPLSVRIRWVVKESPARCPLEIIRVRVSERDHRGAGGGAGCGAPPWTRGVGKLGGPGPPTVPSAAASAAATAGGAAASFVIGGVPAAAERSAADFTKRTRGLGCSGV